MKLTQREEIVTMSQDASRYQNPAQFVGKAQLNSGIVVFSSIGKALYVNKAAQDLLMRLNRKENGHSTNGAFPQSVDNLLDEMLRLLRTAGMPHGWREVKARRLVAAPDQPVLVKGFGIPAQPDTKRSLIVLTIQETAQAS